MSSTGYEALSVLRVNKIVSSLQDVRTISSKLLFLNRTPIVPASDEDIIARLIDHVLIADVVADDQEALTYSVGKVQLETTVIPNIKHGRKLNQSNLNQLAALNNAMLPAAPANAATEEIYGNVLPSIISKLLLGIDQRMEQLLIAMALDGVAYDRFGMKFSGSWGVPSSLKVTPSVPWTNVNATPVNDIWSLKQSAQTRYGETYNRITMSTTAFMAMLNTTEYQTKARSVAPLLYFTAANIPQGDLKTNQKIATNVLGVDVIELYDQRTWSQASDGTTTSAPFLPVNRVILSSTDDDDDPSVRDFANAITTESMLSGFLPNTGVGAIGRFDGAKRGPVAYTTVNPALNPPELTVWGVTRGFPRLFRQSSTANLNVGTFVDTTPIQTDIF